MKPGARIQAAAEVLEDIVSRHQPAATALQDWGKRHRFAGSGDRAAIGTLVYDVLRRRLSLGAQMGSSEPRALAIAAAPKALGFSPEDIANLCDGSQHAPAPLSDDERRRLVEGLPSDVAPHVAADIPEWAMPSFARAFGDRALAEGQAMAERAPIDLRANTLKATRDKVLSALAPLGAVSTALAPLGVRVPAPRGPAKSPHVEAEASHGKGWFEVQDEGSQIAAALSGAGPRKQVLDLCAGAGGKTLALAAAMQNSGQIYAYDRDKSQLRPIFERLQRAGVRNAQVLNGGDTAALSALGPRFDIVFVDAPCSGSGTWRRKPDAKWRLKPEALATRQGEQREVLATAAGLVKPGGRLTYATCSILPDENVDQVAWFLNAFGNFSLVPFGEVWRETLGGEPPRSADGSDQALLLTPASHGTDGFFVATFKRVS
ncbi:RsmB/NOP family class I SAM-dependent RNA methyltransferase [Hyphomicrobium sp.]|uniref:RsmB/NOP family class I SAM-dependent RNA methyltransferase n=1 Tax=Hyphomicrobium sp. TaxID=82 RepID=UPI002E358F58|nr:RsmB/NOP family class I SAM-dependent RNA methyltransferase [Hyphomicrobium sp.]HEX2841867.1 RsmB/NOP family class I SAM-dependent RNA methyltransferase [Hyphomicrobium sp.]